MSDGIANGAVCFHLYPAVTTRRCRSHGAHAATRPDADTTMLHSEAKHPVCAYKWMNWSLTPKVQGDVAAWFGSLPVVPEGCKASPLLGEKGCETNGFNYFDKIA